MKHLVKIVLPIFLLGFAKISFSQNANKDFSAIDNYIKKLGSLDSMNMGTISSIVTKNYSDKTDKARAIFDWIAYNINFDFKMARNGSGDKNSSPDVLLFRKALSEGYANLFQDMCSSAGIRCLTINGFVKNNTDDIGNKKLEKNHTWNVVQLGVSPDAWFYVDPCWGSGFTDVEFKSFTKNFNPNYFFANQNIFNSQHFPDNLAWHIGPGSKSKSDFLGNPLIKTSAYDLGLKKITPADGKLKIKVNKPLNFNYQINPNANIATVALVYGEAKKLKSKNVNFSFINGILSFQYKFEEEDNFPVTVLVNGKELVTYLIEVD